jgi:GxxExxY protein
MRSALTGLRGKRVGFQNKEVSHMSKLIHEELSNTIIGMAFTVHRVLGAGLSESAYEGAYRVECAHAGIPYERQKVFPLVSRGECVGAYIADLVIDNAVIVELKSVRALNEIMEAQLINYLRLSGLRVGYLINFSGIRVVWRRLVNTRAAP